MGTHSKHIERRRKISIKISRNEKVVFPGFPEFRANSCKWLWRLHVTHVTRRTNRTHSKMQPESWKCKHRQKECEDDTHSQPLIGQLVM